MLHLGDITKISGYDAPTVDVIVGGSPCQDLSVAGKRAGLDGERSGLFMEQIRIIKEMRDKDVRNGRSGVDVRPRYMVWENVCGALSSGKPKGEDFRIVLEETAKIADETAVIPRPADGKWKNSGCILGDGWSIAWRVLDAQFWGVPQRRRRIALVADFGGNSASEILFVRKSVSGDTESSQPKRETTSADATRSIGADDIFCIDGDKLNKKERNGGSGIGYREGNQYTLTAKDVHGVAYTMKVRSGCEVDSSGKSAGKGALIQTEKSGTLSCVQDQYLFQPVGAFCPETGGNDSSRSVAYQEGLSPTLRAGFTPAAVYSGDVRTNECVIALDRASYNQGKNAQFDIGISENGVAQSLVAKGPGAVAVGETYQKTTSPLMANSHPGGVTGQDAFNDMLIASVDCRNGTENADINGTLQSHQKGGSSLNLNNVVRNHYTVRRLTPLECERLQGYPDGWTDIGEWVDTNGKVKKTSDAARYKALGNSIALPPWKWVMKRISACYERDATLASLFDGISGFPLIWTQLNGWGSVLWSSEIEEFPIAVAKRHFGDEATGERGDLYEAIFGRNTETNVG